MSRKPQSSANQEWAIRARAHHGAPELPPAPPPKPLRRPAPTKPTFRVSSSDPAHEPSRFKRWSDLTLEELSSLALIPKEDG